MSTQRHVIKRQTVEITLAKKTQAWELQQALSRIFQQRIPAVLDRCLSEAGSPDCLYRIGRLELDLGELDSNRLEAELAERIEASLRQALSEQIVLPAARQQNNAEPAQLELFEHFIREGYLPWWADSSQRQLPEKTFAALLNTDPDALKGSLARLIQEPRSLQRLISYFDDSRLAAMTALLTAAPEDLAASLWLTLSAVQAPLHQLSRMPASRLRTTLRQSLLQVAMAGEPVISRHADFLTAVTVRWANLQGLSHQVLIGCLQQLASSQSVMNNEWLQSIGLSASIEHVPATPAGKNYLTLSKTELVSESSTADQTADTGMLKADTDCGLYPPLPSEEGEGEGNTVDLSRVKPSPEGRLAAMQDDCMDAGGTTPRTGEVELRREQQSRATQGAVAEVEQRREQLPRGNQNKEKSLFISSHPSLLPEGEGGHALKSTALSAIPDNPASIEKVNNNLAFSDADEVYIHNAGLCLLWPFLGAFFERLELVQNGRFHDQAAKQCAASLLHYLASEELNPPEYLLPFNKLLCAMPIEDVFDFDTPLTAIQTEACDELLAAVIDNAPILNNMSVNGFRGSFLLRQGCLSAGDGSWLLRVERETYDLVLERFPWSWRWFKLPWMEYPIRVEW